MVPLLPPGWTEAESTEVDYLLSLVVGSPKRRGLRTFSLAYAGAGQVARDLDLDAVLPALRQAIDARVARKAPDHLFVHGAAVAVDGAAMVIVGPSGSGKSALARELLSRGGSYLSDAFAVLNDRGAVYPYPRPSSGWGNEALKVLLDTVPARPVPLAGIVHLGARSRAVRRVQHLSRAQSMLRLIPSVPQARTRPEFVTDTLSRLPAGGSVLLSGTRDPSTAADLLLDIFAPGGRARKAG